MFLQCYVISEWNIQQRRETWIDYKFERFIEK